MMQEPECMESDLFEYDYLPNYKGMHRINMKVSLGRIVLHGFNENGTLIYQAAVLKDRETGREQNLGWAAEQKNFQAFSPYSEIYKRVLQEIRGDIEFDYSGKIRTYELMEKKHIPHVNRDSFHLNDALQALDILIGPID